MFNVCPAVALRTYNVFCNSDNAYAIEQKYNYLRLYCQFWYAWGRLEITVKVKWTCKNSSILKLWNVKVFSWARTNLYSEPFQHNNWQYIIVLKFITVKYWTQIGLQVNLGWDIFVQFHSRSLSSIYTASSNFLFFNFEISHMHNFHPQVLYSSLL